VIKPIAITGLGTAAGVGMGLGLSKGLVPAATPVGSTALLAGVPMIGGIPALGAIPAMSAPGMGSSGVMMTDSGPAEIDSPSSFDDASGGDLMADSGGSGSLGDFGDDDSGIPADGSDEAPAIPAPPAVGSVASNFAPPTVGSPAPVVSSSGIVSGTAPIDSEVATTGYVPAAPAPVPGGVAAPAETSDSNVAPADALKIVTRMAILGHPLEAGAAVAEVAEAFDVKDLDGKSVNGQVGFLVKHWMQVSPAMAQKLANDGRLVLAGATGDLVYDEAHSTVKDRAGHPVRKAGHIAVVVPGVLAGGQYPNVAAADRSWVKDESTGQVKAIAGPAYSADGQSVDHAFPAPVLKSLRYFTPKDTADPETATTAAK
jgi:hypothetical protein